MSSQSQAAPAAEPEGSGRSLAERLLDALDQPRTGPLAEFVRHYVRRLPPDDLDAAAIDRLAAQVASLYGFLSTRQAGTLAVRVEPPPAGSGEVGGTSVDVSVEDAPFLVDTVTAELQAHGLEVRHVVHPVIGVERDGEGRVIQVTPARGARRRESVMHFEVDRVLDEESAAQLEAALRNVLGELQLVVRDFLPMVDRVERMIDLASAAGARYSADEIHESVEFLQWLTDDSFIYLGYREYEITGEGDDAVVDVVPDSGLGILSDPTTSSFAGGVRLGDMRPALRRRIEEGRLVSITKTSGETTIHRPGKMDYIGVRVIREDGSVGGEARLIGLFTTKTYSESARHIPIVRGKLNAITQWEDLIAGSHDYKAVVALFDGLPKDELFSASAQELRAEIMGLHSLQGRQAVRLFVREDSGGRSVSALVALPPDRVSNDLRLRLEQLLMTRLGGLSVDHHLSADSDPAWYQFIVHVPEGEIPDFDAAALEAEVVDAARAWDDRLADALGKEFGVREGRELARRYSSRFPGYYKSAQATYQAVFDIRHMEQLGPEQPIVVGLQNERDVGEPLTRLKLYKTGGKAPLTDLLPLLEQLGLTVVEEVPTRLQGGVGDGGRYIHDFGVLGPDGLPLELDQLESLVADTVVAVWNGRAGSDWLNRLVIAGGLAWRQVTILRAYREYRQLLGAQFTSRYQNDCLVRNHGIARLLVELFECRFEPTRDDQDERAAELEAQILQQLDGVSSLDDDRILRGYLGLIQATVRTNAFRRGDGDRFAFKFRCADVPGMPLPVPMWEIFVYSTAMAGVHLRGGMVARGGIRWSDRLEDYRTEILGLMKAQMVKNAVIVPVGAKGGFIVKNSPVDRGELLEEERRQYVTLMRGLLDLTDNIVGGEIRHPPDVRVLDGDDAYLVVAADKGTAHLSDTANEVSAEYGFWLGDAFASGGSAGYDHKALGITAKGAWESVKRHFREMGRDVMSEPFTAVGIGDMSGDVFGNGMLLSPHERLVAAFDHRHIFVDPNPDAASSFAERRRLFEKAGSSWDDYDRSLISDGGGVWPRTAKAIPLAPQARVALGTEAEKLTPTEFIQTVLRAPVDLLWNGGIGTYVKASGESQGDVGDRANDAVRVDGRELRAAVVGEGGNLGFTQLGRIEYAAGGGRINTDAIDNSAGVDCSDHEVNLKILLALAVERGELTTEGRDELLQEVVTDVVAHVLYDNYLQVQILSQETAACNRRMEAYEDLMLELEQTGILKRRLEFLPSSEQMAERLAAGDGMVRPELCVLLAYAKRLLRGQVLESSLPDDPYLQGVMREYFPPAVLERFSALLPDLPLRRELIATMVTNDVVNSMGMTFVQRMTSETGCTPDEVCRCFLAARDVSNARDHWDDVERLDGVVAPDVQSRLMDGVDAMVEELARWYLRNNPGLDLATEIAATRDRFSELVGGMHDAATIAWRTAYDTRLQEALGQSVPEAAARFGAGVPDLVFALDILAVAGASGRSIGEIAHAFFAVGERLFLDVIEQRVLAVPTENRWQRLAWSSMLDDLRLLRRQIVSNVIAESDGAPIDDAVEAYLARRADPYQRLARLMETAGPPTGGDVASLIMVLVHQLRQVVA